MAKHQGLLGLSVTALLALAACNAGGTPAPSGGALTGTLAVGYPSNADAGDTPSILAINRLNTAGWKITPTFFDKPETEMAALAAGQINIGLGSTSAALLAIQAGGKFHEIGTQEGVAWLIVGTTEITKCDDIVGKRWALHSPAGVTTGYANYWVKANCSADSQTKITPQFVQGSDNREAALIANQIDATLLDSETFADLQVKAPGKFHAIADLAKDPGLAKVSSSIIAVNDAFWAQQPAVVVAYLKGLMKAYTDAKADPTILDAAAASQKVGWGDAIRAGVKQELDSNALPASLALTADNVNTDLQFYQTNSSVKPGLTVELVANFDPLKQASGS